MCLPTNIPSHFCLIYISIFAYSLDIPNSNSLAFAHKYAETHKNPAVNNRKRHKFKNNPPEVHANVIGRRPIIIKQLGHVTSIIKHQKAIRNVCQI